MSWFTNKASKDSLEDILLYAHEDGYDLDDLELSAMTGHASLWSPSALRCPDCGSTNIDTLDNPDGSVYGFGYCRDCKYSAI